MVLVGHAYPLHGRTDNPGMWGESIQTIGLIIFFSISGYLISKSWSADRRLLAYLQKRGLRIFPALIVVVLLSMFVLGPIISRLSVSDYFADPNLWLYLKNIELSPVYSLPGVFEFIPWPNAVNGSLWSLPAEFACYLMVPIFGLLPRALRAWFYIAVGVSFGVAAQLLTLQEIRLVVWGSDLAEAASVWTYFLLGAAIATAPKWLAPRVDFALLAFIAGSTAAAVLPHAAIYIWWAILPYCILATGLENTPVIRRAARWGDYSYGLYLYAFPVQQLLIYAAPRLSFAASVALTFAISLALAFGSWHLIEKNAMRLKPRPRAVVGDPLLGTMEPAT